MKEFSMLYKWKEHCMMITFLSLTCGDECDNTTHNKSMIQLEKTLLDMGSIIDLCQSILYMFPVKTDDKHIIK